MTTDENNVLKRIKELYTQKGWSVYRLAKESDIAYSSLNNMLLRNTQPTIFSLEKLCKGLGITLSEFFNEEVATDYQFRLQLSEKEYEIVTMYRTLQTNEQQLLYAYLQGLTRRPVS